MRNKMFGSLLLFMLIMVIFNLALIASAHLVTAAQDRCTLPELGAEINLAEGSFAGLWGEVLNFQRKGSAPPIMVLRLSDNETLAIVDACMSWTPSAGLVDAHCEAVNPGDPESTFVCRSNE